MSHASTIHWLKPKSPAVASCLLMHGLNNSRDVMLPLARTLRDRGFECALAELPGHDKKQPVDLMPDFAALWIHAFKQICESFRQEACTKNTALIAYSLSALVYQAALGPPIAFEKNILIAPAFAIRSRIRLLDWPTRHFDFMIPSLAPEAIRAHRALGSNYYRALFTLLKTSRPQSYQKTLFVFDEKDELVDPKRVLQFEGAKHQVTTNRFPHHWMVSPENMTDQEWTRLCQAIDAIVRSC